MGNLLYLESFDQDSNLELAASTDTRTYADGYAAGLADAEMKFSTDTTALTQELVQSVSDAAFGYHEAQVHLIATVTPLLETMLSTVLPAMLSPALHAHILELVQVALATDVQRPVTLKVPPSQHATVKEALSEINTSYLEIVADPDLGTHAVWMTSSNEETALDLDGTLAAIMEHMSILVPQTADRKTMEASQHD